MTEEILEGRLQLNFELHSTHYNYMGCHSFHLFKDTWRASSFSERDSHSLTCTHCWTGYQNKEPENLNNYTCRGRGTSFFAQAALVHCIFKQQIGVCCYNAVQFLYIESLNQRQMDSQVPSLLAILATYWHFCNFWQQRQLKWINAKPLKLHLSIMDLHVLYIFSNINLIYENLKTSSG